MKTWPLRFRHLPSGIILSDDAGSWFRSDDAFVDRYSANELTSRDWEFLRDRGHAFSEEESLAYTAFAWRFAMRQTTAKRLAYIILVPTLRCNLSCGYCQVSRAAEQANGYDWTPETTNSVIAFLDKLTADEIKVEFQGGEPLLRLDLLDTIRRFCRKRFSSAEFVICTNLQVVGEAEWSFLDADDTFISTSLDGDVETHRRQRTANAEATTAFFQNLEIAIKRVGTRRISALPTVDVSSPPDLATLLNTYDRFGLHSIYLRPINHQGFARRRTLQYDEISAWNKIHSDFVELLIDRNERTGRYFEEYYFTHCLRRVLAAGNDSHVDLRNPTLFATDYVLIDYDGSLYPTDEARMLARIGHVDLSIGHVSTGFQSGTLDTLNSSSMNNFDPDCIHCPYQPYCGTDVVDDIGRYGRIDVPRFTTWFCNRHMAIFDKVFELVYRNDARTRRSLARWAGLVDWPTELAPVYQ